MPEDDYVIKIIKESVSASDVLRKLGLAIGGCNFAKIKRIASVHGIDLSHFSRKSKYSTIRKCCPACQQYFNTTNEPKEEKTTCSYACSNRYFRTKNLIGKFNSETIIYNSGYRTKCLNHYKHKCAFCDWNILLEVHHIDRNRENNDISNLIPLCPNHHRMTMRKEHRDKIDKEIWEFKKRNP